MKSSIVIVDCVSSITCTSPSLPCSHLVRTTKLNKQSNDTFFSGGFQSKLDIVFSNFFPSFFQDDSTLFICLTRACVYEAYDPRCTKVHREDLSSEVFFFRFYNQLALEGIDGSYTTYINSFRLQFGHIGFLHLIGNRGPQLRGKLLLKFWLEDLKKNGRTKFLLN